MSSERQALNTQSPWWGEHVHRYDEVIKHISSQDKILDIACGTGFGSDLMAAEASTQVIGGDIDTETIADCNERWDKENLSFQVLDGTALSFEDGYFDKIVSFETIEHTTEYKAMLSEFSRVLKNQGTAFISTPNFLINSPSGIVTNPYHTQEFVYEELESILSEAFGSFEIFGQKYIRYADQGKGNKIGKITEQILYQRGIRKIPIALQDNIMKSISPTPMHPLPEDYAMVKGIDDIIKCKTFFAVCRKH